MLAFFRRDCQGFSRRPPNPTPRGNRSARQPFSRTVNSLSDWLSKKKSAEGISYRYSADESMSMLAQAYPVYRCVLCGFAAVVCPGLYLPPFQLSAVAGVSVACGPSRCRLSPPMLFACISKESAKPHCQSQRPLQPTAHIVTQELPLFGWIRSSLQGYLRVHLSGFQLQIFLWPKCT